MFRSFTPPNYEDFDILRYPHQISRVEKGKDGQLLRVTRKEDSRPVIDPLLDASWTDVENIVANGINIPPIGTYIQSSLEDRAAVLHQGLDIAYSESEPTSEVTPEPTPEPTPEATPEPNV